MYLLCYQLCENKSQKLNPELFFLNFWDLNIQNSYLCNIWSPYSNVCVCVCVCVCIYIYTLNRKRNISWISNAQIKGWYHRRKLKFLHTSSPEAGECFFIVARRTYRIAGISWGITSEHLVCPPRAFTRHASPVHGVNKAVDKGHWNRGQYLEKGYTHSCCSYWNRGPYLEKGYTHSCCSYWNRGPYLEKGYTHSCCSYWNRGPYLEKGYTHSCCSYWNRSPYLEKGYTHSCCSYWLWAHFMDISLDFTP